MKILNRHINPILDLVGQLYQLHKDIEEKIPTNCRDAFLNYYNSLFKDVKDQVDGEPSIENLRELSDTTLQLIKGELELIQLKLQIHDITQYAPPKYNKPNPWNHPREEIDGEDDFFLRMGFDDLDELLEELEEGYL